MLFEEQKSVVESAGQKIGTITGVLVFTTITFFVVSKARLLCWSLENYAYFATSILLVILVAAKIKGGSNGKNKIVS